MALALSLGRRGLGQVWPWPSVGCVIVNKGRIVGRGVSDRATMRHAEVVALAQAGELTRGATAYVTLEPCSHHGNTPPCCDALIAAGVVRVVAALGDPNPQVNGQGLARLRAAGVEVATGLMAEEARADHAGFLSVQLHSRPFVTLKLATTLDGRIATASGESRWITGAEARRAVHAMRMRHDAVMVGGGTARADDPDLTVRDLGARRQPVRVVLDSRLSHQPDSRLGQSAQDHPVWMCHAPDAPRAAIEAWRATGARLVPCPVDAAGLLEVRQVLGILGGLGLTRIFCEGGAALAASLVRAGLVDELALFNAGKLIGQEGLAAVGGLSLERLADAPGFGLVSVTQVGADCLQLWRAGPRG